MATIPSYVQLTSSSVDILNAIRNSATANYRNYVPEATASADSIRDIGAVIMQFPVLQNEFLSALINRIGRVIVTSKMYSNPWSMFKKGIMEYGETIENIFVNIAEPFQYDPAVAESQLYKRNMPDVRAAFHILNYQKFYKDTIQEKHLKQAFLSWDGITELIAKITESMYTAANYDEFLVMKYMLAKRILNGNLYPQQIDVSDMHNAAAAIKGISNNLEFMSTKYNVTGVTTHTVKDDQYLILNADFDAYMDVGVLASAFHMDKAEFMGHRILVDSFGELDTTRLAKLFADDDSYQAPSSDELTALKAVPGVLVDREWFMIYDNLMQFNEKYNEEGLYWNYWLHNWKIFSANPFANAVVFVPGAPAVSSVTMLPATATVLKGQSILISTTVATTNFASKAVTFSATHTGSGDPPVQITPEGVVTVLDTATTGDVITVTGTSVFDSTKTDTTVITVG